MNIPLPRFTFIMGPTGLFLDTLAKSEPTAEILNMTETIEEMCDELGIKGRELELEQAIRLIKPDFLGHVYLSMYRRFSDECQMIFTGVRTRADVVPFAAEYGPRTCLIIRLGELLPNGTDANPVHTIWLPPMEAQLQMKHLEAELTKQLAPIEATTHGQSVNGEV